MTREQIRALAAQRIETGEVAAKYDAVLIDEAQDLQPTALRVLVGLCKTPGGLFLTADANQSIYGGSFRWSDVHASLQFQGRTGILKANHRSTREIAIAAESYFLGYRAKRDGTTRELLKMAGSNAIEPFTCLNSLRDVEPMITLLLDDHGLDDDPPVREGGAA